MPESELAAAGAVRYPLPGFAGLAGDGPSGNLSGGSRPSPASVVFAQGRPVHRNRREAGTGRGCCRREAWNGWFVCRCGWTVSGHFSGGPELSTDAVTFAGTRSEYRRDAGAGTGPGRSRREARNCRCTSRCRSGASPDFSGGSRLSTGAVAYAGTRSECRRPAEASLGRGRRGRPEGAGSRQWRVHDRRILSDFNQCRARVRVDPGTRLDRRTRLRPSRHDARPSGARASSSEKAEAVPETAAVAEIAEPPAQPVDTPASEESHEREEVTEEIQQTPVAATEAPETSVERAEDVSGEPASREPGVPEIIANWLPVDLKPAPLASKPRLMKSFQAIALLRTTPQIPSFDVLPLRPKMTFAGAGKNGSRGARKSRNGSALAPEELPVPAFSTVEKGSAGAGAARKIARWLNISHRPADG